jgi:hypothetical protein
MFVLNGAIGLITPPVGTVLNVVAGVGRLSMHNVIKGVNPFLFTYVVILALFVAFPQIVTARLAFGQLDPAQHPLPGDDQPRAYDQPRHDARDEERRDRGVGRDAVDHERHRRRDDRRDGAAGSEHAGRGVHRVALLAHHRQQDRRERCRVGEGGAAHARGDPVPCASLDLGYDLVVREST